MNSPQAANLTPSRRLDGSLLLWLSSNIPELSLLFPALLSSPIPYIDFLLCPLESHFCPNEFIWVAAANLDCVLTWRMPLRLLSKPGCKPEIDSADHCRRACPPLLHLYTALVCALVMTWTWSQSLMHSMISSKASGQLNVLVSLNWPVALNCCLFVYL